jgi:hypothetical protein
VLTRVRLPLATADTRKLIAAVTAITIGRVRM